MQLHTADDELNNESVSVLGNERFRSAVDFIFARSVEVTGRNRTILFDQRREEGFRKPVVLDEFIGNNPEDLGPDFTNGMHTPVTWLVESLVCRGVNVDVLMTYLRMSCLVQDKRVTYSRVYVVPDASFTVGSPGTHAIV